MVSALKNGSLAGGHADPAADVMQWVECSRSSQHFCAACPGNFSEKGKPTVYYSARALWMSALTNGLLAGGHVDPAADVMQWVECSRCHKWRSVGPAVYDQTVASQPENHPWYCETDFERPGASCEEPQDPNVPT